MKLFESYSVLFNFDAVSRDKEQKRATVTYIRHNPNEGMSVIKVFDKSSSRLLPGTAQER